MSFYRTYLTCIDCEHEHVSYWVVYVVYVVYCICSFFGSHSCGCGLAASESINHGGWERDDARTPALGSVIVGVAKVALRGPCREIVPKQRAANLQKK